MIKSWTLSWPTTRTQEADPKSSVQRAIITERLSQNKKDLLFSFVCVSEYVWACEGMYPPQKTEMLDPLELELQTVVICHEGARNWTQTL